MMAPQITGSRKGRMIPMHQAMSRKRTTILEDGVDQRRFNGLVHTLTSHLLEVDIPALVPSHVLCCIPFMRTGVYWTLVP